MGLPWQLTVKNMPPMQETWVGSLGWHGSLVEGMATLFSFLPGESYGQRSLEDYSPWGHKELDMTEVTEHKHKVLRVVKINKLKVEWLLPESRGKG